MSFIDQVAIDRAAIDQAAQALKRGKVIAYPTEGVWGLGCAPFNAKAVDKILQLKGRPVEKGMIIITDHANKLAAYIRDLPDSEALTNVSKPTTWLLEHGGLAPDWLSGGRPTLAIRISDHIVVKQLCQQAEMPLVSTSANPAGKEPARTAEQVKSYFGNLIDVIVPGELGGHNGASEIRDFKTGNILREAG